MQGWIKLHRKLLENPIWEDPHYLKLWIYCLMKATHKEREVILGNQIIILQPGEFITGRKALSEDLNKGTKPKLKLNESTWWRYLNNLGKLQMLNIKKTNKYSVVTILNWNEYQENEQQMNNKRTSDEQQMNTNKNVKNVKNISSSNNSDADFAEIMKFYRENLQKGISESLYNYELIQQWFDEWGKDLLLAAMKLSAQREAKGTAFIEGVLKNWKDAGVNNLEQARQYQLQFKQSSNKSFHNVTPFKPKEEDDGYDYGF